MSNNLAVFCSLCLVFYIVLDFFVLAKYKKENKALKLEVDTLKKKNSIDIAV